MSAAPSSSPTAAAAAAPAAVLPQTRAKYDMWCARSCADVRAQCCGGCSRRHCAWFANGEGTDHAVRCVCTCDVLCAECLLCRSALPAPAGASSPSTSSRATRPLDCESVASCMHVSSSRCACARARADVQLPPEALGNASPVSPATTPRAAAAASVNYEQVRVMMTCACVVCGHAKMTSACMMRAVAGQLWRTARADAAAGARIGAGDHEQLPPDLGGRRDGRRDQQRHGPLHAD
jgi:hypothetical protein